MQTNSKKGFVLSVLLHCSVAATALFVSLIQPPEEEKVKPFELVFGAPNAEPSDEAAGEAPSISANLPAPLPRQPPQQRRPQPAPTPRPPDPVRTPTPVPAPPTQRPTPAPQTTPQPETMSLADFRRLYPQTATTPPRQTTPRPVRNVPRISTDQTAELRNALAQGSLRGTSTAEQNALLRYLSAIRDLIHDAWDKPVGIAQTTQAIVDFEITADGHFASVRITKSSGNGQFDQSVLESFRNLGSVGPPPTGKALPVHLTISLSDE